MEAKQPTLTGLALPENEEAVASIRRAALTLKEFQRWAKRQSQIVRRRTQQLSHEELILAQAIKLGEEVGELYAEVLGRGSLQRPDKASKYTDETLAGELADVFICTAVLAQILGADLVGAVQKKIEKVNERNARMTVRPAAPVGLRHVP